MSNDTQNPYYCLASSIDYDETQRFLASHFCLQLLFLQCTHFNALFARVFASFETVVPKVFNLKYHVSVLSIRSIWSEVFSVTCL